MLGKPKLLRNKPRADPIPISVPASATVLAESHRHAIAEAVQRYEKPLLAYAISMLHDFAAAQDAVQETFLKLCRHDQVVAENHLAPWLFKVCRHRVIDMRRKKSAAPLDPLMQTAVMDAASPQQSEIDAEEKRLLAASLETLTTRQQEVLRLRLQAGLSYREIAQVTGLSVSNVGFHLHQAIKSLRLSLSGI